MTAAAPGAGGTEGHDIAGGDTGNGSSDPSLVAAVDAPALVPPSNGEPVAGQPNFGEWLKARGAAMRRADNSHHAVPRPASGVVADPSDDDAPLRVGEGSRVSYGDKMVASKVQEIASAVEHTRNDTLNGAVYHYARVCDGLGRDVEWDAEQFRQAAYSAGLEESEVKKTVRGVLDRGRANPRAVIFTPPPPVLTPFMPDGVERLTADAQVRKEVERLRIGREARRLLDREEAGAVELPTSVTLAALLAEDIPAQAYRIDGLLPSGGRAVLGSQAKAGKSTMTGNGVRVLVDGGQFLDKFTVHPIDGSLWIFDTELSRSQLATWLRAQRIVAADRVHVVSMRGRAAAFDVRDAGIRARWATVLREHHASFVILDCVNPVLSALGLNEDGNSDVGGFLAGFDALLAEAGGCEALVTHHHGHSGERTRGASKWRDWPDAEWKIVREVTQDGQPDTPAGPRYFSAYGRDVDVAESQLGYDLTTRRLSIVGGDRRTTKLDLLTARIVQLVTETPGIKSGDIVDGIPDVYAPGVRNARAHAVRLGLIRSERADKNNATLWYPVLSA